jgi:photosystem II stability/assembly factor-like uncharacterized protein
LSGLQIPALAVDPTNPNVIYAGTAYHGVYKSIDGGVTWIASSVGLPSSNLNISTLLVDPTNPSIVYLSASTPYGIFKSLDAGATWVLSNAGMLNTNVTGLGLDPHNSSVLVAAIYGNCGSGYRSQNGAAIWTRVSIECDVYRIAFDPVNVGVVYAGAYFNGGEVFKSTDDGVTWTNPSGVHLSGVGAPRGLAINPAHPTTIYAGTEYGGVLKSVDGAASFTALTNGPSGAVNNALALDPNTPTTVVAGLATSPTVFKSTDEGAHWTDISAGLPNVGIAFLLMPVNDPHVLYAGTAGAGVYRRCL